MTNIGERAINLLEANHKIKQAVESACLVSNITEKEFYSKSRERHLVDARRMVYSFCRNTLNLSWLTIAKYFKVNHATCIHHNRVHEQLVGFDKEYERKYDGFAELVKAEIGFVDINSLIEEIKLAKQRNLEALLAMQTDA